MIPLFENYPGLHQKLPFISLGTFPTPVVRLQKLEKRISKCGLYLKRDDVSGALYGGNKIRKLEFVFADALRGASKRLITSGAAGSNHCLAVALYGKMLGFKVVLMLTEQPLNPAISANLKADYYADAELHLDKTYEEHQKSFDEMVEWYTKIDGCVPYVIAPGGSSITGAVGYVNAAFELRQQIRMGELPEPAIIYVPLGTMGTAAGLLLGLKAAGIKSRIVAVSVVPSYVANREKFNRLFDGANKLLHDIDNSFPLCKIDEEDFCIETGYFGQGYGIITTEALDAIKILSDAEGFVLDGVYTGKAFAAFLHEAVCNYEKDNVLYWQTKNSVPLPQAVHEIDYQQLPIAFHHYFNYR